MGAPVGGWVSVGLEGTPGVQVKGQCYLDAVSEGLKPEGGPIRSNALTGGRMPKKVVMDTYDYSGPVPFHVTPDKITKLLYSILSSLSTTVTTDPRTHVFKTGTTLKALTLQTYRPGPDDGSKSPYTIYPGAHPEYLEFRQAASGILLGEMGFQGIAGEVPQTGENSDVAIAYSANDPFIYSELAVTIGGGSVVISDDWKIRIASGLIRKRHLAGQRPSNRAYAGDSMVTGEFGLTWEAGALTEYRKSLGSTADTSPIAIGSTVALQDFTLVWTKSASKKITIQLPNAYYKIASVNIAGRDQVTVLRGSIEALYDTTSGSDVVVTVINSETNANIITAGTTF